MIYTNATIKDIEGIRALQKKFHVDTVSDEDRPHGFVTTLFTEDQLADLIEKENGIVIAKDGDRVISYAMAASWEYWSVWPFFAFMIEDLPSIHYLGRRLSAENSYQYGPICIDTPYRGSHVLLKVFDVSREQMNRRYPVLITFINQINGRSVEVHTRKLGLEILKEFSFNRHRYFTLGYDTSVPVKGL